MTYVETRVSLWETLAGRAPGAPVGEGDPRVRGAVNDRLDPARARPVLRDGIEWAEQISARGVAYVMLRSPDGAASRYLRLSPEEWLLAQLMDGSLTVARLVAEFARIAGRLAPGQVRRVVADLAANRMLDDLPADAFGSAEPAHRRAWPVRLGAGVLAVARGRRMVVADVDRVVTGLYRAGGRFLFTRPVAWLGALVAAAGIGLFVDTWAGGSRSIFLTGGSYVTGALALLLLNVLALACHELGHALATKHAGRRVPAAGVFVHFGIPSVFVDTTDVWMAGRRARMRATAAGPAAGLVLAGLTQLLGLLVPALAPLAFTLSFLWYLNVLVNLNPFVALDGYHLLVDWLEIPNLRGRALAWLGARLRGKSPAFSALDREGRLVALYSLLGVLWLAVAGNVAYRIFSDRVAGLATGLWPAGWWSRLLLVLVVTGLAAPALWALAGWLAKRWHRARARLAERDRAADAPRRLAALRASELGRLPEGALTALAGRARWVRPDTGAQLVLAGSAQPAAFVVVDGALQGRRRGDPGGGIRHLVGPGGVVGLSSVLTGRPATLDWHTAGTTLLALPPAAVATVIGPLPGPPPGERAAAEALLDDTPALAGLGADERLGLIARAHPVDLEPGAAVVLPGPTHAVVVESGVIAMPDGTELRRGTMIGPVGEGSPGAVAQARTPVRLWVLPDASDLPPLVGGPVRGTDTTAAAGGAHAGGFYPPLAVPPGPPPEGQDNGADPRFEKRLWWLVLLLLLLTGLLTAANVLWAGPAWAEMPADRGLLTAERGRLTAVVDGSTVRLAKGERRYVGRNDRIEVGDRSTARLEFRGGGATVLCAGTRAEVGALWTVEGADRVPHAVLSLDSGRVLADSASTSGDYAALALTVQRSAGPVVNAGPAWYAVDPAAVAVATGQVTAAGSPVPAAGANLSCADGVPVAPPAGTASETPSSPPVEPSVPLPAPSSPTTGTPGTPGTPTGTDAPADPDDPGPGDPGGDPTDPRPTTGNPGPTTGGPAPTTPGPTAGPTTGGPTGTTPPPTEGTSTPPPTDTPTPSTPTPTATTQEPVITGLGVSPQSVACAGDVRVTATVTGATAVSVRRGSTVVPMADSGSGYAANVRLSGEAGTVVALTVSATGAADRVATRSASVTVTDCPVGG